MKPKQKKSRTFSVAARAMFGVGMILCSMSAVAAHGSDDALSRKFVEIETRLGARLGATIIDTHTGKRWTHRSDERFPLTSTFKAFACAGLLARVDAGEEDPNRLVVFQKSDLVSYSPVTEKRVGSEGMTLSELCEAATSLSDNSAGNMVLDSLGGPAGFTKFMRSIGDDVTRLDRKETGLNEAVPGDSRDTTTPNAIARTLQNLILGDKLSLHSRHQLENWLVSNQVGGPLLRAGLPEDWRIADRTGAGGHGSRSIVAVVWPPQQKPLVVAIYITGTEASIDDRNAAIAEIGRTLAKILMTPHS
jgi:beta-lactamase class A